jgi:AraC-like DNA-binding protein
MSIFYHSPDGYFPYLPEKDPSMLLKDFLPCAEVREFVRLYRIVHFSFDKHTVTPTKAYAPRPEQCLAFYPRDVEQVEYSMSGRSVRDLRVAITGQQLEVSGRKVGNDFLILQVVFQPTGLFRLTGVPSFELTNQYLDAEAIFGNEVRLVNEQLYHASSYDDMLAIANRFLVKHIRRERIKDHHGVDSIGDLILHHHKQSLDWFADQSCLSVKQFERKFKERCGVTPKLFARITRFDRASRLKSINPDMDWLSISLQCGYSDYQHLVRDFKDFTGVTPVGFYHLESKAPERQFGLNEAFYQHSIQ